MENTTIDERQRVLRSPKTVRRQEPGALELHNTGRHNKQTSHSSANLPWREIGISG
jgi:hypothetical protein